MELDIPILISNYKSNMSGVDLANQFREAYDTNELRTILGSLYFVMRWAFD
jgi:hypothetical protein